MTAAETSVRQRLLHRLAATEKEAEALKKDAQAAKTAAKEARKKAKVAKKLAKAAKKAVKALRDELKSTAAAKKRTPRKRPVRRIAPKPDAPAEAAPETDLTPPFVEATSPVPPPVAEPLPPTVP